VACSGVIHVPDRLDTNGISGGLRGTARTSPAKVSATGSIMAEWKACEVRSSRHTAPASSSRARSRSTASAGPETVHASGAFTAASDSSPPSSGSTPASPSGTASIAPPGSRCISRPRAATSPSASSSEKTPASVAATYSPTLCPSSASGRTPHPIHSFASAYSTTNSAGCASSVRRISSAAAPARASGGWSTSRRSRPRCGRSSSAQRSTSSRKLRSAR